LRPWEVRAWHEIERVARLVGQALFNMRTMVDVTVEVRRLGRGDRKGRLLAELKTADHLYWGDVRVQKWGDGNLAGRRFRETLKGVCSKSLEFILGEKPAA